MLDLLSCDMTVSTHSQLKKHNGKLNLWSRQPNGKMSLIRALAHPVTRGIVVASHEGISIAAHLFRASHSRGLSPHDLRVMPARVPKAARIAPMVIPLPFSQPRPHCIRWLPVPASTAPENVLAIRTFGVGKTAVPSRASLASPPGGIGHQMGIPYHGRQTQASSRLVLWPQKLLSLAYVSGIRASFSFLP